MVNRIKCALVGTGRRLSGWLTRARRGIAAVLRSGEGRRRLGYYAALALLLVLLGSASYAWRARRESAAPQRDLTPREVISLRVPSLPPELRATPEPVRWAWPLEGELLGAWSPLEPVWSETLGQWQTHPALDIAGSPGEAVYACRDGVVADAWSDRVWGNVAVIDHDEGYRSTYAGLNTLEMVNVGDEVTMGQVIGSVGQSAACEADRGWHLHFELTKDGEPADFQALVPAQ